jgi:ABC-type transporter MlaC component
MRRLKLFRCVILAIACLAARSLAADEKQPGKDTGADQTPVDAAKDYTQKMKSAQPAAAIRAYWDMDAILGGIFGEHLRRHNDEERAEMKRLLLEFLEKVYANPKVAQAMKDATFADFTVTDDPARGTATVDFTVRFKERAVPNSLLMKQTEGKWRIVDAGANGRMMVRSMRSQYEPQAQKLTPLQYVKEIVSKEIVSKQ